MSIIKKFKNIFKYPSEEVFYIVTFKDDAIVLGDSNHLSTKFLSASSQKLYDITHSDIPWANIDFYEDEEKYGQCKSLMGVFEFWGNQHSQEDEMEIYTVCVYINEQADDVIKSISKAVPKIENLLAQSIEKDKERDALHN